MNDALTGNTLANNLVGGAGNDTLTGGAGNDTYVFDTDLALGSDIINESGGGTDTLNFAQTTTRTISVDLSNAGAQVVNAGLTLTLSANNTIENVLGGSLGDTLIGNSLANTLTGNDGNDVLSGRAGNDSLVGGNGKNILIGGDGADLLTGGASEDLLLGARYLYEADTVALEALLTEWISASSFANRVAHLQGTLAGGLNSGFTLTQSTVKEDSAPDTLTGGNGAGNKDWYLRNSTGAVVAQRDVVNDTDVDSVFEEISTWL